MPLISPGGSTLQKTLVEICCACYSGLFFITRSMLTSVIAWSMYTVQRQSCRATRCSNISSRVETTSMMKSFVSKVEIASSLRVCLSTARSTAHTGVTADELGKYTNNKIKITIKLENIQRVKPPGNAKCTWPPELQLPSSKHDFRIRVSAGSLPK